MHTNGVMEALRADAGAAAASEAVAGGAVHVLGRDDLPALWSAVDALAAGPLQSSVWLRSWLETLGRDCEPLAVAVGAPERPAAVAALAAPRAGRSRLELMSVPDMFEPVGLLGRDPDALVELGRALRRLGRPLALRRLEAGSPALAGLAGGPGLCRVRGSSACPWIPLDETWLDPLARMSSSRRSDLRRLRRRADALGEVVFEHHDPREEDVDELLATCFEVEAASWKGRAGTALAVDRPRRAFYELLCRRAAARGLLRIELLRIDGRAVAMQINLAWGDGLWGLKTGYDEEVARAGPGVLLAVESFRHAAEAGFGSFELLGAMDGQKATWHPRLRELVSVAVYPASPGGAAAAAADGFELARRAARARLRRGR